MVEGMVPLLVRSNEKAVVLEMFREAQASLLAFPAHLITSVKHCEKSIAAELTV